MKVELTALDSDLSCGAAREVWRDRHVGRGSGSDRNRRKQGIALGVTQEYRGVTQEYRRVTQEYRGIAKADDEIEDSGRREIDR